MAKDYSGKTKTLTERFKKANKQRKRVMIAEDVLAQLRTKRFVAEQGTFVGDLGAFLEEDELNKDLKTICRSEPQCNVCAIGGMFVSAVEFHNKLKVSDVSLEFDYKEYSNYLSKWFEKDQLKLIEIAFEDGNGAVRVNNSKTHKAASEFFGDLQHELDNHNGMIDLYLGADEKMRLIMENIVRNKGTFVPEQKPMLEIKARFVA